MVDKRQQDMGMSGDADMQDTNLQDEAIQRDQTDQSTDTGDTDMTGE